MGFKIIVNYIPVWFNALNFISYYRLIWVYVFNKNNYYFVAV